MIWYQLETVFQLFCIIRIVFTKESDIKTELLDLLFMSIQ